MRNFSQGALAELFAQNSADPFLMLLTVTHSQWATKRFVNNNEEIISRGLVFTPLIFDLVLPVDDGETIPTMKLVIDNVGLTLMSELRKIETAPDVKLEVVFGSDRDRVEMEVTDLKLNNVKYDKMQITGVLSFDDFLNTAIPSARYTPKDFPGMF